MAAGLQVFDASGNAMLDITDSITRILGTVSIAGSSPGSVTDARFSSGRPFYSFLNGGGNGLPPTFSLSGNTLSWNYARPTDNVTGRLVYGVY